MAAPETYAEAAVRLWLGESDTMPNFAERMHLIQIVAAHIRLAIEEERIARRYSGTWTEEPPLFARPLEEVDEHEHGGVGA